MGLIVVLALVSISPVKRLNAQPPSGFLGIRTGSGKAHAELARQYWDSARNVLQWRYPQASPLPSDPPDDFRPASGDQSSSGAGDAAARRAYWQQLRGEWLKPDNWHTAYTMDAMWMWRDLAAVWNDLVNFIHNNA